MFADLLTDADVARLKGTWERWVVIPVPRKFGRLLGVGFNTSEDVAVVADAVARIGRAYWGRRYEPADGERKHTT